MSTQTEDIFDIIVKDVLVLTRELENSWNAHTTMLMGPYNSISADLGRILEDTEDHDVKIRVQGKEMTAHKCILGARSSVFKAMLKGDWKESKESVLDIHDVIPEAVKGMLKWIYTGKIFVNKDKVSFIVLDMLKLANCYDMPQLMRECEVILVNLIKHENVTDILTVADRVQAKKLKEAAIQCILKNKSIVATKEFTEKVGRELFIEIFLATDNTPKVEQLPASQ